jgi:hypothetical protein
MKNMGLVFKEFNELYGLYIFPIDNNQDFLIELVKYCHLGIEKDFRQVEFDYKITRMLEYVLRIPDPDCALLLTETLFKIQLHTKIELINRGTNINQLCNIFGIQFKQYKKKIYYNTLRIINKEVSLKYYEILTKIKQIDGNIFECFDISLSLELLHTYLILDKPFCNMLFMDILGDWKCFRNPMNEEQFEKLLLYGFALGNDDLIKEQIMEYESFIKSDRWSIKFYRNIKKNLAKEGNLNLEKIERAIKQFAKLESFSAVEKEFILQEINSKLKQKTIVAKKMTRKIDSSNLDKKFAEFDITNDVIQLSPYNLPPGIKLGEINKQEKIHLAVFENEQMKNLLKIIHVNALCTSNRKDIYFVNKPMLKFIKEEAKPGYIHVINDKKNKAVNQSKPAVHTKINKPIITKNSVSFSWPSTNVTGSSIESESDFNKLHEKSALRKMGYQITNTSREMRWSVLQRAVPALGLKKVAFTIASHIKLRKGQKNGKEKFSYAIREWEHDLKRLKRQYYKKDFTWPST